MADERAAEQSPSDGRPLINRRRLLVGGAAATGLTGAAAAAGWAVRDPGHDAVVFGSQTVPFFGAHQAGIETPAQAHAAFVGLNLRADSGRDPREALQAVLALWTTDAERLTQGVPALADTEPELAVRPSRLTVTVGLGPGVFDRIGAARLRPASARPLPRFRIDRLEQRWGPTDLLLQICSDDPMALAHATRVLLKNVRSLAVEQWRQTGFHNARGAHPQGETPRNLMGQVDGTVNPIAGTSDFDTVVWDDGGAQRWLAGGTLMVLRRIRMDLDAWDALDRGSKELTVGRRLDNGAPLTGGRERDPVDLSVMRDGIPVIPPNAHVALAHPVAPEERFLRRPYSYDDAPAAGETSNSGLIFVTYQRDIDTQFVPVQRRLADADALNRWITPIGSAVYVIPPGIAPGGHLGEQLFAAMPAAGD